VDTSLIRELVPAVIGVLVRRGADFASAEDAVQEALVRAYETWPHDPPRDPKAWLIAAAWRKFLDAVRAESARRGRELTVDAEPPDGPVPDADDTLRLYFLCAHPTLSQPAAVALTLRAVGGLTTRPIATAHRDTAMIAEGVTVLQTALAPDRLGDYQAQAAIAALHADARAAAETDWVQIVEWYDELLAIAASPVVRLNRAVAVGEADGAQAGLTALADVDPGLPRYAAARAYLLERAGDLDGAATGYAEAARVATSLAERDHLTRESARLRQAARR